jgi:hypothetical protein
LQKEVSISGFPKLAGALRESDSVFDEEGHARILPSSAGIKVSWWVKM